MSLAARVPTRRWPAGAPTGSSSATCSSTGMAGSIIVSGFFEPVFYLLGIGFGLGTLVGDVGDIPYSAFVAPGLMATAAMNGALYGVDVQPLLQAALRQDVRRHPVDAARATRTWRWARWPGR